MEILIIFVAIVGAVAWTSSKKRNLKDPRGYKGEVKRLLKDFENDLLPREEVRDKIIEMAGTEQIRKYFQSTYGNTFFFREDELPLESYFLVVFGDMRTHYIYGAPDKKGRRKRKYQDYYIGGRNYTMVVTTKNIYFSDDLKGKHGRKPRRIPLEKIVDVVRSPDYVELEIKTKLKGKRVHNIWSSSGETVYFLLLCVLGMEKRARLENITDGEDWEEE